ncbi:MAG: hypothetical protein FJ096_17645 [Deltaproteobacteria bacterium]|nr:hypothetical protein [Deltaproteobacteria bacterium]
MHLFEVFLTNAWDRDALLSPEILESSGAQIFDAKEAELVGFEGIPDDPSGRPRVFIACSPSDEGLIASRLEANASVEAFRLHRL